MFCFSQLVGGFTQYNLFNDTPYSLACMNVALERICLLCFFTHAEVMKTLVEEIKNDAANMTSILVRVLLGEILCAFCGRVKVCLCVCTLCVLCV